MFRYYSNVVTILYPLRFIPIICQLVLLILLLLDREENVRMFMNLESQSNTPISNFETLDTEFIIWLSFSIGILVFELISFMFTITSLIFYQTFISILSHSIGVLVLFAFYIQTWPFRDIRWVLGFCTVIPFLTELYAYLDVFSLRRSYI
ncbi:transmembrane protein -like [Brachionus plicatilis]|uniref:Transmembrane protein 107 n=1 Tax=Brachionus plicatilis TaxID=10195 RepID=A0A3M7T357_BRAPC|nr:transmembrane protein -like [Brachionus plicatilis]